MTKKREREKKAIIRAAKEAQRRAAQSAQAKRRMTSPKDIVEGFVTDVLNLLKYKIEVSVHIDTRLKQAESLKERFPEKFSQLRIDELKEAKSIFEEVAKQIDEMAAKVGLLEDMKTYQDKLRFISENASEVAMAQFNFNSFGTKLQGIDKRYVESFAKNVKSEDLAKDLAEAGIEFEPMDIEEMSKVQDVVEKKEEEEVKETSVENSTSSDFIEVPISDEDAKVILEENKVNP